MLSTSDFSKKQVLFVFFNDGEKISFSNDNVVIKNSDGKIKLQISCYRIFLIYAVGNFSITNVVVKQSKKFGFSIALMTANFRIYDVVGFEKNANTLLKKQQYSYDKLDLASLIISNKIFNQQKTLKDNRNKSDSIKEAINTIEEYIKQISSCSTLSELMAYEGLTAKLYFRNHFNNVSWNGRKPRIKADYINSTLDIGYTILFAFIEALLVAYGFDTYCGVLHKQFYMRKSLVCDLVEPFRCIIDVQIKKSINLKQINEEHFVLINRQYQLKWEKSQEYATIFMKAILDQKDEIFLYIQSYYRAFIKDLPSSEFPFYKGE